MIPFVCPHQRPRTLAWYIQQYTAVVLIVVHCCTGLRNAELRAHIGSFDLFTGTRFYSLSTGVLVLYCTRYVRITKLYMCTLIVLLLYYD